MPTPAAIPVPPCRACHGFGYRLAPASTDALAQPDPDSFGLPQRWATVTPRKIVCEACGGTGYEPAPTGGFAGRSPSQHP